MSNAYYQVAVEKRDVVVRLDRDLFDQEAIEQFLDYLALESLKRRSQLTPAQAADLADEIDRVGWSTLKTTWLKA